MQLGNKPIPEEVREYLHYEPITGIITWTKRPNNSTYEGDVAGYKTKTRPGQTKGGYITIRFKGIDYQAHRIAYYLYHNIDPGNLEVDHIDRDPSNNSIANLRLATRANQQANLGALGYTYVPKVNMFKVSGHVNGKPKSFGYHRCPLLARYAYLDGTAEYKGVFQCKLSDVSGDITGYPEGKKCEESKINKTLGYHLRGNTFISSVSSDGKKIYLGSSYCPLIARILVYDHNIEQGQFVKFVPDCHITGRAEHQKAIQ